MRASLAFGGMVSGRIITIRGRRRLWWTLLGMGISRGQCLQGSRWVSSPRARAIMWGRRGRVGIWIVQRTLVSVIRMRGLQMLRRRWWWRGLLPGIPMSRPIPGRRRCRGVTPWSRRRRRSHLGDLHRLSVGAGHDPDRYPTRPVPFHGGGVICVNNDEIRLASIPGLMVAVRMGMRWLIRVIGSRRMGVGE